MPPTTVHAGASMPAWRTGGIARNGVVRRFRVNTALRQASDRNLYQHRVEVAVPMADPGWAGQPTAAETQRLAGVGEKVLAAAGGRAVLAAEMTAVGVRWYIFYTGDAALAAELSGPLREALGDDAVSVSGKPDGDWQVYTRLLKDGRKKYVGWAFLGLAPFLFGAISWHAYGPGWALADLAALVLAGALVFRTRKQAQWCLAHPVLMFGGYTLLMASILFALGALVGLLSWLSLGISLMAGGFVNALIWKSQVRFWEEQQLPVETGPDAGPGSGSTRVTGLIDGE